MEDLDPPREVRGAARQIIEDLSRFGMVSDEDVVYQSQRHDAYQQALDELSARDLAFDCGCARRDLEPGKPYPGTCENGLPEGRHARSVRLRVPDREITFIDQIQGAQAFNVASDSGAFIIRRADGLFAYQLAVVVDDEWQNITHVMRGADLLDSTPRQICLQSCLGYTTPEYAHHPVAVDLLGNKLSKQTMAQPVDASDPIPALRAAWDFLGQRLSTLPLVSNPEQFLACAVQNWEIDRVPKRLSSPLSVDDTERDEQFS